MNHKVIGLSWTTKKLTFRRHPNQKGIIMPSKFQIQKSKNGKFFFHLLSANGEVILTSQMYSSRETAKKGIAAVKLNAAEEEQFEMKTNKGGEHYFVLKAKNQRVIGSSEGYSGTTGVKNGIKSVSKLAASAIVENINVKVVP